MEKVALAAQGHNDSAKICARCFADVPAGHNACPECGAPVTKAGEGESDEAVYKEIAQANLFRMRHEFGRAEQECLSILRRYPNNVTANVLLGDICMDLKEFDRGVQWYELALDLKPDDAAIKSKIKDAKERITHKEAHDVAEKMGIPKTVHAQRRYVFTVVGLVLVTAIASYIFGTSHPKPRPKPDNTVTTTGGGSGIVPSDDKGEVVVQQTADTDANLLKLLSGQTVESNKVASIFEDPRSHSMILTYLPDASEDYRSLGARLGSAALGTESESLIVTLRAMQNGKLIYTADLLRYRLNETKSPTWRSQHPGANDWIDNVLTNEWEDVPRAKAKSEEKPKEEKAPASAPGPAEKKDATPPATDEKPAEKTTTPDAKAPAPDTTTPKDTKGSKDSGEAQGSIDGNGT